MKKKMQKLAQHPLQFTAVCLGALFLAHALFFFFVEILPRSIQTRGELAPALYVSSLKGLRAQNAGLEELFFLPTHHAVEVALLESSVEYSVKENDPSLMWWRFLPICEPLFSSSNQAVQRASKIFWRGEIASYVQEVAPIQIEQALVKGSAYNIRYAVQVDLKHGRMLYLEPLEEEIDSDFAREVRAWIWCYPFDRVIDGGIVSGEIELCFGGEYAL